ncbi:hypothetical protein EMIT0P265_100142 [Pseudomonas zeae]
MQCRDVGQCAVGTEPHIFDRIGRLRVVRVLFGDRAHFDRFRAQQFFTHVFRNQVRALLGQFQLRRQIFRADHHRHLALMFEACLVVLKRSAAGEDRMALLDRRDAASAETAAIAHAINRIDHRQLGIARTQEIAVHRMYMARLFNGLTGRRQRLAEHLATEQLTETQILATATEQVFFDRFQGQQVDQIFQHLAHSDSPHTKHYAAQSWLRRPIQILARANDMAAIVNVRVGLSMQGLQPLFPSNAVQQMPSQRMIDRKLGVIKIIFRGVMHADRLHDFL